MKKKILIGKKLFSTLASILMISSICVLTPSTIADGETHDYVIITTDYIVENSEELDYFIHMKEMDGDGHSVKVVTESEFMSNPGQPPDDRADRIRKWLQDNYKELGIEYVLLIGDPDPDDYKYGGDSVGDIPMKMCYPRYFRVGDGAPTDLYYSDLTSEWDLDGDGFYHESQPSNSPLSPVPGTINPDYFSVEWSGYIQIDHAQTNYDFRILSDDGIRIRIGGSTVDMNDLDKEDLSYTYVDDETVETAGRIPIELQFWENTGDAVCKLFWKNDADGGSYKIIPSDKLYTADSDSASGGLNAEYFNNEEGDDPEDNWWLDTPDHTKTDSTVDFIWGTGDIGPSDPDYTPEVYVGRIPVYNNDYEQLDKILRKIINYETDPGDISWRHSILLPMVESRHDTPGWGLGEAIMTDAAIPSGSSYYRIYEPGSGFSPEATVPESEAAAIAQVRDEWKNGYGMVTWYAHGYPGGEAAQKVMDTDNVGALDDSKPSFTMQPSCFNAWPENPDNLAYSLLKNGAIATIASTRMTTFRFGAFTSYNPVEYVAHQVSYYYTLYVMRDNMPAGEAYAKVVDLHSKPNANAIEYNLYGDPECQLFTVTQNDFPVADANGPYNGLEGSAITFDAGGSSDPEGSSLDYRWDFDNDGIWDTGWLTSSTTDVTWGDDYSSTVNVEVRDDFGKTDIASSSVTVENVAPSASKDAMDQPNPQFILPHQILTFQGGFMDPGWLDTHQSTWDWGDSSPTVSGTLTEENFEPDSTGTTTADHAYLVPGTYTVTLTINDDEGGSDSVSWEVEVVTLLEALEDLDDYIQDVDYSYFKEKAKNRLKAFDNKFNSIYHKHDDGSYQEIKDKLNLDIRILCDGLVDGDPLDDWIIDQTTQDHICMKIDDITEYLDIDYLN